jgi:hypothetical protein
MRIVSLVPAATATVAALDPPPRVVTLTAGGRAGVFDDIAALEYRQFERAGYLAPNSLRNNAMYQLSVA